VKLRREKDSRYHKSYSLLLQSIWLITEFSRQIKSFACKRLRAKPNNNLRTGRQHQSGEEPAYFCFFIAWRILFCFDFHIFIFRKTLHRESRWLDCKLAPDPTKLDWWPLIHDVQWTTPELPPTCPPAAASARRRIVALSPSLKRVSTKYVNSLNLVKLQCYCRHYYCYQTVYCVCLVRLDFAKNPLPSLFSKSPSRGRRSRHPLRDLGPVTVPGRVR